MSVDLRLKQRLAEQLKSESETIQGLTRQQLDAMQNGLQSIYADVLNTIEADMQSQSKALARRMKLLILWPSVIWLGLLLTLSAGAWGIGQYQWTQIQERQQTLLELDTQGIEMIEQKGKKYVLMPKGATANQLDSGQVYVLLEE